MGDHKIADSASKEDNHILKPIIRSEKVGGKMTGWNEVCCIAPRERAAWLRNRRHKKKRGRRKGDRGSRPAAYRGYGQRKRNAGRANENPMVLGDSVK